MVLSVAYKHIELVSEMHSICKTTSNRETPWNVRKADVESEKRSGPGRSEVEQQPRNEVVISIEKMLRKAAPMDQKCTIHRVPKRFLNFHPRAYTPQCISIGLYHWYKRPIDDLKSQFLNSYLRRINMEVEAVFTEAQKLESKARSCYVDSSSFYMNKDNFVKMMLLDGCFIVEFMMTVDDPQSGLDPSLYEPISIDLYRDLLMLENQLPFFVLETLFDLCPPDAKKYICFKQLARNFLAKGSIGPCKKHNLGVPTQRVNHLLDFLSFYYTPFTATTSGNNTERENLPPTRTNNQLTNPPTATALSDAGVVFKKAADDKHILDMSLKNGVMEIPPFEIHDVFEYYIRNLMAFEHFSIGHEQRYAIQYVFFLDGLISTEKDASLLVEAKIITNHIGGSNGEIVKLFNDLCKDVAVASDCYYFDGITKELHNHCARRRNRWMASLRRDYFNSPWASISFSAATFLLLLTLIQTISSVISIL